MEMILAWTATLQFIVFGSFWFWTVIFLESAAIIFFLENEKAGRANMSAILFFVLLWICSDIPVVSYVVLNPLYILCILAAYLAAGTLWSIAKWYFFVLNARDKYKEEKDAFCRNNGITADAWTPEQKALWEEYIFRNRRGYSSFQDSDQFGRPVAGEHKERIILWMCYWPWSMFWTILNDPFRRLFLMIYEYVQSIHDGISKHVYRGMESDFLSPDERNELARAKERAIAEQDRRWRRGVSSISE